MSPADIVTEVTDSGLRGRGGAAFPTGIKWRTVLDQPVAQKYIACNADEGDSGTFSDRMIMEGDPFVLIEGMIIAGLAVGATEGYIYLRVEYPHAKRVLEEAIAAAYAPAILAPTCGAAAGASISTCGLARRPTSAARRPRCSRASRGSAARFACARRCRRSRGCSASRRSSTTSSRWRACRSCSRRAPRTTATTGWASRAARCRFSSRATSSTAASWRRRFGVTLRELLYDYGGGSASGRPDSRRAGRRPAGRLSSPSRSSTRRSTMKPSPRSARCSVTAASSSSTTPSTWRRWRSTPWSSARTNRAASARRAASGRRAAWKIIDGIRQGRNRDASMALLDELCETMLHGSLCGLGGLTPYPVQSALKYFREDF